MRLKFSPSLNLEKNPEFRSGAKKNNKKIAGGEG
jgi:hypothetical protein